MAVSLTEPVRANSLPRISSGERFFGFPTNWGNGKSTVKDFVEAYRRISHGIGSGIHGKNKFHPRDPGRTSGRRVPMLAGCGKLVVFDVSAGRIEQKLIDVKMISLIPVEDRK